MSDLALFDFDGTLTTRELLPDFIRAVVPRWRLRLGGALLAPLMLGYRRGWVSGVTLRAAIARVGLRGLSEAHYHAVAQRFRDEVIPASLRTDAMQRLKLHVDRGDAVVIVSGAFDAYLVPWGEALGVRVLCSRLEVRDGVLTGRYAGAQCVGAEKARRVRAAVDVAAFARVHAYGDTPEDADLLALADVRHYRGLELAPGDALPA